jgi:hypothetical protein
MKLLAVFLGNSAGDKTSRTQDPRRGHHISCFSPGPGVTSSSWVKFAELQPLPQEVHVLIPRTCEYVPCHAHGRKFSADGIKRRTGDHLRPNAITGSS